MLISLLTTIYWNNKTFEFKYNSGDSSNADFWGQKIIINTKVVYTYAAEIKELSYLY